MDYTTWFLAQKVTEHTGECAWKTNLWVLKLLKENPTARNHPTLWHQKYTRIAKRRLPKHRYMLSRVSRLNKRVVSHAYYKNERDGAIYRLLITEGFK